MNKPTNALVSSERAFTPQPELPTQEDWGEHDAGEERSVRRSSQAERIAPQREGLADWGERLVPGRAEAQEPSQEAGWCQRRGQLTRAQSKTR